MVAIYGRCDEVDRIKKAVAGLAGMHAKWWNKPKAPPLDWVLKIDACMHVGMGIGID